MHPSKRPLIILFVLFAAFGLAAKTARAMTIEPPSFNLTVNPGDEIKDVLHITNENSYPVTLQPKLLNFMAAPGDETSGAPSFYPADEVKNGHELAPWITLESTNAVTIPPRSRVNIPFTIDVPKDARPGGHFGAIHVGTLHESQNFDGVNVGVLAETSALIFVRVNGDVRDDLSIASFGTDQTTYTHLPANFAIRLQNQGTTHLIPVGNIFITDALGRQVASLQVNGDDLRRVLPDSIRRFDLSWSRKRLPKDASEFIQEWSNFALGRYTATLVLNYGDPGAQKLISAVTDFWVFPWMVLLGLLLFLAALALLIRYLGRRYNRMIISRYETMKKQGKS